MFGSVQQFASKQLYHLHLNGGHCELATPDTRLQHYIDYYWFLNIDAATIDLEVIPDTAIDLVLCPDVKQFAALYFPVSEKFSLSLDGPVRYSGVCFHSATISELLGFEVSTLRKLGVGSDIIERLLLEPLIARLKDAPAEWQIQQLNEFWLTKAQNPSSVPTKTAAPTQAQIIQIFQEAQGTEGIAKLCDSLQLSERQFRRLTQQTLGISPKKMLNILRLQSALSELFACNPAQIQDLYYDDSHRIRELKRLTGLTPGEILQMAEKYNNGHQAQTNLHTPKRK
ncbi:MAG: helix-turn-helix domain-containing protein [Gammaproteobacteria bacterium]|nr:helix-turn-helix domain-containing protein [Gammaproteobacteria bacterium]